MIFTLENWSITPCPRDPYLAPELRRSCLQGWRENEEDRIVTSPIVGKTPDNHIQTQNSTYILGAIDPLYEQAFPNAHERLLASLPIVEETE